MRVLMSCAYKSPASEYRSISHLLSPDFTLRLFARLAPLRASPRPKNAHRRQRAFRRPPLPPGHPYAARRRIPRARLHERAGRASAGGAGLCARRRAVQRAAARDVRRDELHRGRGLCRRAQARDPRRRRHRRRRQHAGAHLLRRRGALLRVQFGEGRLRQRHRHGADARGPAGVGALRPPLGAVDRRPRGRPGGQGRRGARLAWRAAREWRLAAARPPAAQPDRARDARSARRRLGAIARAGAPRLPRPSDGARAVRRAPPTLCLPRSRVPRALCPS